MSHKVFEVMRQTAISILLPLAKKRAAKSHPAIMGLLLFVGVVGAYMLFLFAPLLSLFGPLTAYGALAATLTILFVVYAYLVKVTGAKPVL